MVRNMADNLVFHGPNAGYVLELYDQFLADPDSLDPETRAFLAVWAPPADVLRSEAAASTTATSGVDVERVLGAHAFADALRRHGHLAADTKPIGEQPGGIDRLSPAAHDITEADLSRLPASIVGGGAAQGAANALEATQRLRTIYCGTSGFEFAHVQDRDERTWLRNTIESDAFRQPLSDERKRAVLQRLTAVEGFERFLHQTYLGQKRFSIEGTDILVPMLDEIINAATSGDTEHVVIGMAHRGRLNVLTHVLGKPYRAILAEFEHGDEENEPPSEPDGYSGDVKYHLGWRQTGNGEMHPLPVVMAPNPSHLEFVNPVLEGMTRALQDKRNLPGAPEQNESVALPVVLHGDAAFPGQGVVAETLNLSRLPGYSTGGTIHIIVNNQVGFTTDWQDARSTLYASDLAKGFEIPIVHVNADDPEACLAVARLALAYREQFHRDFLIDLIGYRRWGHNEGDEPSFTQPKMYAEITAHETARAIWAGTLEAQGVIPEGEGERLLNAQLDELQTIRESTYEPDGATTNGLRDGAFNDGTLNAAGEDELRLFNDALHTFPDSFTLNAKLKRQLERRRGALDRDPGIDWAHAESLAFASILAEGVPIRLTGQDSERGTFSQRHLMLHDPETGDDVTILHSIPGSEASFAVFNSPLSETGVLGFEYGYTVAAPDTLVLWEAQFGDFVNSAQVIIDQFIIPGEAKWRQRSALVLLLPHGYEGQGPEHSSARLERFLQMAANNNIRVVNCTSAAQYFHLLRRQAALLHTDPRPLIVMTPKSLLRHPKALSSLSDLAEGGFQEVIDDSSAESRRDEAQRLVLCSGKVHVDLSTSDAFAETREVAVARVEELYPFPHNQLRTIVESYPNLTEVVWLQEEPQNMGAWRFIEPRLRELLGGELPVRYIGRRERASPAEGSNDDHQREQTRIVAAAFAEVRAMELSVSDD
ncbi:2-oxoglutarate dehydrogenase E1 component [soil metagenome]